jgi:lambda family phage portal protein
LKLNAIDKIVGYIAPTRGLERARARLAASLLRDYDAASYGRRTENWLAGDGSANRETARGLHVLRKRHRELVRNNPWAARAVQAIVGNTVGIGVTGELKGTKKAADSWKNWATSTDCDADGCHNLYAKQAQTLRTVVESGDALLVRRPQPLSSGMDVPLKIQLLEGDYLDHTKTHALSNGHIVIQGVEFDSVGRRVAYWLFPEHPGDVLTFNMTSEPVPASDVAHIYRQDRPGQVRGVPWGAPVMITMRDLDDYEDALLYRQKLANCFMAFVHDHSPDITGTSSKLPMPETLEPGLIAGLPPGKDVKFAAPPQVDGHGEVMRMYLHRVASGYGITYQALTGILTDVNFSSGKMGQIQMDRNIDQWRWHMLVPQMCRRVEQWWLEAADLVGVRTDRLKVVWTPPRKEMLDPPKETKAAKEAIRGGLFPLQEWHRQMGLSTEDVLDEIEVLNKELDKRKITLDVDARQKMAPEAPEPQETDE